VKRIVWTVIVLMVSVAFWLLFTGPRMYVQPHIRTFQTPMPLPPKGVVAVQSVTGLPSLEEAKTIVNPLAQTSSNLACGKVYYTYYCQFCHGHGGAGDGPVGQSYVPVPADLRSAQIQSRADGELLRAMLTGIGHEPVLERIVPPAHRWFIILYVRSLATPPTSSERGQ
jgi:hypothetical protein